MIILTGASGGLGQAIRGDLAKIDELHPISHKNGLEFDNKVNLEDLESIKRYIEYWKDKLNHITLIHLAAVKIDETARYVSEASWDKVFNVNIKGAFFLSQFLLPIMTTEKWGRIIWVISSGLGDIGTTTYSATKFGLLGISEVLSKEYARFGITSNILQLGYFPTGMYTSLSPTKKQQLLDQIPSGELGDPKNIVNAIKMIIDSDFVNGSVINIDGGV